MTRHYVAARDEIYPDRFGRVSALIGFSLPRSTGPTLILTAFIGYGLATILQGAPPANWYGNASPPTVTRIIAGISLGAALIVIAGGTQRRTAALALLAIWSIAVAVSASNWISEFSDVTRVVSLIEALVITAAASVMAFPGSRAAIRALSWLSSAMMLAFGLIHLTYREAISGLLPPDFPAAHIWPLITGTILVVAGLASLFPRLRLPATLITAAMFLSWIVMVHVPRLIADGSFDEWIFAITALALAGCLIFSCNNSSERRQ